MKIKFNLFGSILKLAFVCVFSENFAVAQTISAEALKNDVYYLASDSMNGRQTGSKGEYLSSDYIIRKYKALGLQPMGSNGSFLQPFETNVGIKYSGENYLSVNRAMLQSDSDYYALNFSASGMITGYLQSAGYGINAPQIEVNDFEKINKESGTVFLIESSSPDGESPHSKYYPYLDLQSKIQSAIKSGATAVIIINTHADAEDPAGNFSKYLTPVSIPVVFVKKTAYEKYFTGNNIRIQLSVSLEKISITGHNVIAYKNNGAKNTVVLGAHYDHLGHNEYGGSLHKGEGSGIHNGADDNASGTAGVLALASVLSKQKNANNNYLFINFSGEELGLIGSKYFTEHSTVDTNNLNYMINMDMIGRYNPEKGMEIGGLGTSPQFNFIRTMKDDSLKWKLSESGSGPSDFTSFYHINVPVLYFFTGTHEDYHKPTDDADKLNYKKEAEILELELKIIDSLNNKGTLVFVRTKESESTGVPTYKVKLGIVPDYMYEGIGLRVDGVNDGLVASKAGIQKGDIIIKMGDFTISDIHVYMKALGSITKGDTIIIVVKRGDEEKKIIGNFLMPNFLLIETAASVCSVATANENGIISVHENDEGQQHATLITVFAEEVMKEAGLKYEELNAVIVSAGPGSYTGLRIGVSAAKGICYGLQIPMIAIDSLQALAIGFFEEIKYSGNVCAAFDARRDEVYFGIWNEKSETISQSRSAVLNDEFISIINSIELPIAFVGSGAEKIKKFLSNEIHEYHSGFKSSAKYLLTAAIKKFNEKDFADVAYFEPNYIKPFYFAESKKI